VGRFVLKGGGPRFRGDERKGIKPIGIYLPLVPAKAGTQPALLRFVDETSGPRFRGDEREGIEPLANLSSARPRESREPACFASLTKRVWIPAFTGMSGKGLSRSPIYLTLVPAKAGTQPAL